MYLTRNSNCQHFSGCTEQNAGWGGASTLTNLTGLGSPTAAFSPAAQLGFRHKLDLLIYCGLKDTQTGAQIRESLLGTQSCFTEPPHPILFHRRKQILPPSGSLPPSLPLPSSKCLDAQMGKQLPWRAGQQEKPRFPNQALSWHSELQFPLAPATVGV